MGKLVFLHKIKHFDKFLSADGDIKEKSTQLIALTIELRILFQFKRIDYSIQEDYLSEEESFEMDLAAFDICRNWYKEYFMYQGISLGLLVQWDLYYYYARVIRDLNTLLTIIERENPTEIISFEDSDPNISDFNDTLKYICSLKNIKLRLIPTGKVEKSLVQPTQVYGERLITILDPILQSKPFKLFFNIGLRLLWKLKKLKMKKFQSGMQKHLTFNYYYHQSVINEMSRKDNIILLNDQLDFRQSRAFIQNFKDLFLNKPGGYHLFLESFETFNIRTRTNSDYKKHLKIWKGTLSNPEFQSSFKYKNINIWPIVKDRINSLLLVDFKRIILNIQIFKRILGKNNFQSIILSNDVTEKAMTIVLIASKLKIPSIVIQHGITGNFFGFVPSFSTKFAAWGKISKNHLVEFGMEESKLEITGSPRFDEYITLVKDKNLQKRIRDSVYRDFGIEKHKKLIVWTASPGDYYRRFTGHSLSLLELEKEFTVILKSIKDIDKSHLILKTHPSDKRSGSEVRLMKKLIDVKNVSIVQHYNLRNLLIACDCAISGESTTTIEILILGKPLICINLRKRNYLTPVFKYKVARKVSSYEELLEQIPKALEEKVPLKEYEEFLKDYNHKIDGLSTERIIEVIEDLKF